MDFGALPPEINSARMSTGPGAAPMMAAAAAWNGLGAEWSTTGSACESVISALTGEEWLGPASAAMAAAAAWNGLGAELSTTGSSCESVISALTGEEWLGPASAAMAAAAAPYVAWMNTTAAAAERAATQAMASAAAYQTAFAMTVPPPVIAANRTQLAARIATNFLGVNSTT